MILTDPKKKIKEHYDENNKKNTYGRMFIYRKR